LKLYTVKGWIQKKRILLEQIPLSQISSLETFWDEITITWNGTDITFSKKSDNESFNYLAEKLQPIVQNNKQILEKQEKGVKRKIDLKTILDESLPVADSLFDILIALNQKGPDWTKIHGYDDNFGDGLHLSPQTLSPLVLDYAPLSIAIEKQHAQAVASEASKLLKSINEYFTRLAPADDLPEEHPNFEDVTTLVTAYYTLNDILLGKFVTGKEKPRMNRYLEGLLKKLAQETNFKVNIEELKAALNGLTVEADIEGIVIDARELFKEPLIQLFVNPNPKIQ
jgi:hypothetical protein